MPFECFEKSMFRTCTLWHVAVYPSSHYAYVIKQFDRMLMFLGMNWVAECFRKWRP